MARITVEDCLKKIDSQYDLVLLAKERTSQLNAGEKSLVPEDNDKNIPVPGQWQHGPERHQQTCAPLCLQIFLLKFLILKFVIFLMPEMRY